MKNIFKIVVTETKDGADVDVSFDGNWRDEKSAFSAVFMATLQVIDDMYRDEPEEMKNVLISVINSFPIDEYLDVEDFFCEGDTIH